MGAMPDDFPTGPERARGTRRPRNGRTDPPTDEKDDRIARGGLRRSARLASLPLGFAGRSALGLGRRLGGASAEQVSDQLQQKAAEQLFKVLGELKGGAMKFGQALSVMEAAMPEELAGPYRATLTKLQDAAPPMSVERVHAILAEQLGPRWRTAKFQSFEDRPVAAASIGQVHRAVWRDGRTVAVEGFAVSKPANDAAYRLYSINLATGEAADRGSFDKDVTDIAIGLNQR